MTPHAIATLLLATLLAAGCSPGLIRPPVYVAPPESPASAKIQVRSSALAGSGLMHVFDDGARCIGPRQLASSATPTRTFNVSSRLASGAPSTLYFQYRSTTQKLCRVAMTFVPEPGRNYLATAAANETSACALVLFDITDQADIKPVRRRAVRSLIPTDADGAFCRKVELEAEFAKAQRPNRSNMKMSDLADILPPEPAR